MDEATWYALMLVLVPALISMIVKPSWSNGAKYATAFVVSFVAAMGQLWITKVCTFGDLPVMLAKTFLLVMGSYAAFWRPTGLAQKIEEKVNVLP